MPRDLEEVIVNIEGERRWLALIILCLGDLMIVLDSTVVNVALPSIRSDLGFSETSLVWVVNGQPRLRMDVRFGSDRTPTREGWFSVGWKSRHHVSSIYHSAMPYAMFFSGGQARWRRGNLDQPS